METTDFLDSEEITEFGSQGPNQTLHVMCILGYIGNGLLFLLFLIVFMLFNSVIEQSQLEELKNQLQINNIEDLKAILTFTFGICLLLTVVCIVGLIGAHKGKTWGFILYAISNGIWAIMLVINLDAFNVFVGLISIGFIFAIGMNYKK